MPGESTPHRQETSAALPGLNSPRQVGYLPAANLRPPPAAWPLVGDLALSFPPSQAEASPPGRAWPGEKAILKSSPAPQEEAHRRRWQESHLPIEDSWARPVFSRTPAADRYPPQTTSPGPLPERPDPRWPTLLDEAPPEPFYLDAELRAWERLQELEHEQRESYDPCRLLD